MHDIQTSIPSIGQATIGLVNHPNTIILSSPFIAHSRALIWGTVIDQNYLKMPVGLFRYAAYATIQ
ncbi:hypothetical protein BIFCAT_01228 [Bifidobacterium catenulatum DSM 16992 = JCM 1194 = LMG 11043]|jgi:hypothetical protein|uniref:Uncharacterized protein n=1 Tax=Bifidobacterium catenulatum DSM 16992 = JCM 1194 = LMG 11043 TaxID=566552 RepID=B6XVK0_9BIFI|nr:hypothetical protein BIFCAT_01228 [Bifidobacterium catenulatum DSM 16992 = JCM 1194 = LMG 11043]